MSNTANRAARRTALAFAAATLAAGVLTSAAVIAQGKQMVIATGGTGGVYYPLGGGLAAIIGKEIPGTTATAQVTGGSVANLQLIGSGKADLGFSQVDAAWDAFKGQDKFAGKPLPVRALAVVYPNHMHVVTVEGTGINKIEDLKGKRISTGSPGSATEVYAFRVLEAAGLDKDKDVTRERLGAAESVNAMKDKKIEAFFWVGGLPTAAVTDLAATPNTTVKLIDIAQLVASKNAKYGPLYAEAVIPMATYKGMAADAKNSTVWNIVAVNESMSEADAYALTKIVMEKKADLALVHAEGGNVKIENQSVKKSGIPFHPGAIKYFKEKGINVE